MNKRILAISIAVGLAAGCSSDSTVHKDETSEVREQQQAQSEVFRTIVDQSKPGQGEVQKRRLPESLDVDQSQAPVMVDAVEEERFSRQEQIIRPRREDDHAQGPVGRSAEPQDKRAAELAANQAAASMKLSRDHAVTSVAPPPASIRHASEPLYREQYEHPGDYRVTRASDNPVSTFSIDVDTGAYTNARRWLTRGSLPPEDAVRVEEFINYFDYDYERPSRRDTPFVVETEVAPSPWNADSHLLRIGIQGYEVPKHELPASNLVFLVDVSGSMHSPDKLPLLKQSLGMLTRQLDASDCISIVVYAGASGVVLNPTPGNHKAHIINALNRLEAGGSTNGAAGLELAYQMARQNFKPNGVNRVILATDGDFNVGQASTTELIDMIQRQRDAGIALTTLGFGTGNYNDHMLEQLADEGNGNHAYIDRLSEAQKVLNQELSSTLLTIASDVKIQLEFNPQTVAEYRLIGYENRALNEEDFNNDKVDAGEIGAGHRVTALYELSLRGADGQRLPERRYSENRDESSNNRRGHAAELAHLRIRYKKPGSTRSRLIESPIMTRHVMHDLDQASDDFRFAAAVAAFGQKLRGGRYLESWGYSDISELASQARGHDPFGYRGEFLQLVSLAEALDPGQSVARRVEAD